MEEPTFWDTIKLWWADKERDLMNYILKKNGFDFGRFYMSELIEMYQKNEHLIKRD